MEADYYLLLGVEPDADLETIKAAYCRMARECHPDRGGSHERMLLLNEAWDVLSNAERRRKYDESRAKAQSNKTGKKRSSKRTKASTNLNRRSRKSYLSEDFARAAFNSGATDQLGCPEPGDSISGQLFVMLGFSSVGLLFGWFDLFHPGWTFLFLFELFCAAGVGLIGARLGALLHLMIGQWIGVGGEPFADESSKN